MGILPGWAELEPVIPQVTATMRRYLAQIGCVLRPGSVSGADLALRSFAAVLTGAAPGVTCLAQVRRRHIEDYKPWLTARPGQNKPQVTTATIAHRLGTLRMFFVRLDEWGWDEAPPRVPMFPGDLPRQDHPLPRALDDASAAKLLRRAGRQAASGARTSPCRPARWSRSALARGCTCRSASCARTVTCRCTRT
jgi:site-specific recombinase XerD